MERARHSGQLTERQREVLRLLLRGHTNGEIAEALGISLQGAKWHVRELLAKFGVESREELIEADAAGRSARARIGQMGAWLVGIGWPKVAGATFAGLVAIGGAATGVGVAYTLFTAHEGQDIVGIAAAPTALPTPTVVPDTAPPVAAGEVVRIGWHNDLPGGAYLGAYFGGLGWCVAGFNSDASVGAQEWCEVQGDPRDAPITSNLSTTFSVASEMGEATLRITTRQDIVRLVVLPGDGRRLEFSTYAPPAQSALARRFAWLNIGKVAGSYTVVGFDASGTEIYRLGTDAPVLPPELIGGPRR